MDDEKKRLEDVGLLHEALDELRERVRVAEARAALLRAGLGEEWTDERVLSAFAGAEQDGVLGAVLAVLVREEGFAREEAEACEAAGKTVEMSGAVGAGRRLKAARERVISLWEAAQTSGKPWGRR